MHCDALTQEGAAQVTRERLQAGGCLLQCFAAFVSARENRFDAAHGLIEKFRLLCEREGYQSVQSASEMRAEKINALLTVEEGGAVEGSLDKLETLYLRGVRMMTLTWNYPNEIGYPNFPDYEGLLAGCVPFTRRERERGLTPFGVSVVEKMGELGMIVDVSHGSDQLFSDVAEISKRNRKPFVASHSGANRVYDCARNLYDEQIRTLAECGGVVGLDFCADFLSDDKNAEGQKAALLAHARAIVNAGGEDVLSLGSDFDGIPENAYLKTPADMPKFLETLEQAFGARIAEKIARHNFLRVLKEVCG